VTHECDVFKLIPPFNIQSYLPANSLERFVEEFQGCPNLGLSGELATRDVFRAVYVPTSRRPIRSILYLNRITTTHVSASKRKVECVGAVSALDS